MVSFNTLNPNWNNEEIKNRFSLTDESLNNSDRFYYITSDGKLAYFETRATNSAEVIAKVYYTLGLMNSDRVAKEPIANGILCSKKHIAELQADSIKEEAKQVLKDDIADLLEQVNDLLDEVKDKTEALNNL